MRRRHFIAGGAAAVGIAGCSSGGTTAANTTGYVPNPGIGPVPSGGTRVTDLRYVPGGPLFPAANAAAGYTPAADAAALIIAGTPSPATSAIPGIQVVGSYGVDEQYVIRVPDSWNGKLVVIGTPALRTAFASDAIWQDYLLSKGYATAASNKGVPGNVAVESTTTTTNPAGFFPIPYDLASLETNKLGYRAIALTAKRPLNTWNDDFANLTIQAKAYLAANNGKAPTKTYAVGLSNGGAQVRSLLEQHPDLVDGGVDWSGVYWNPQFTFLDYLPVFLKNMATYVASNFTSVTAAAAIQAAGYPADVKINTAGRPSLWYEYYSGQTSFYSDLTLWLYALLIDPSATSNITAAGCTPNGTNPTQLPGTCAVSGLADPVARTTYVPSAAARANIAAFAHTGRLTKPLISIAGTADMFITPANNATAYLNAAVNGGYGRNIWQYLVQGGTHVDTFANPALGYTTLQPQLAFAWRAFDLLVNKVEGGTNPTLPAGTQTTVATPAQMT